MPTSLPLAILNNTDPLSGCVIQLHSGKAGARQEERKIKLAVTGRPNLKQGSGSVLGFFSFFYPIGIDLDKIDISVNVEVLCYSGDDIASIRGLANRFASIPSAADVDTGHAGPDGVTRGIGLDNVNITTASSEGECLSGYDIASIRGLANRIAPIIVAAAVGPGPDGITRSIGLDKINIILASAEGECPSGDDIASIRGRANRFASIRLAAAVGPGPDGVTRCIGLDKLNIIIASA